MRRLGGPEERGRLGAEEQFGMGGCALMTEGTGRQELGCVCPGEPYW